MTNPPCSRVSCDKCGCPMENSFEDVLIAKCRITFLKIDDPVAVADVLCENRVISNQNHAEILETVKVGKSRDAKHTLFNQLSSRPNWFQSLTDALENEHVDYPYFARELRNIKSNLERTHKQDHGDDDVFAPGETASFREPMSTLRSDSCVDSSPYHDCASYRPTEREESPYCNVLPSPEEHPYDRLDLSMRRTDQMEKGVHDPNAEAPRQFGHTETPQLTGVRPLPERFTNTASATGHRRAVSDATPASRRHSLEGPRTCPVYDSRQRQVDRTFFSGDFSYSDVESMKGWASAEYVDEAEQWLSRSRKGSYFVYGEGGKLVLAVKFESWVERFYMTKTKSSGLGEYKLQGQPTTKKTRRDLLDFIIKDGIRSSQHDFQKLHYPWRSATS